MTEIQEAQQLLQTADAVLISASNGLSISEGYNIFANNAAFKCYFGDFTRQYGITSILQGSKQCCRRRPTNGLSAS